MPGMRLAPGFARLHAFWRTAFGLSGFLVGAGGAGLIFGFAKLADAAMDPAVPGGIPAPDVQPLLDPSLWFSIDAAGTVTVNIIRAEMGQHVGTALARILADELEADWGKVRIVHVDSDPKWGLMVTGDVVHGVHGEVLEPSGAARGARSSPRTRWSSE